MSDTDALIAQLQDQVAALEQASKSSETDNVLNIQRNIVALERAKQIAHQAKMKRDVRSQIARGGWYNPEADQPYVYQEYPKTVRKDGREIIVKNAVEERRILGLNDPLPKTVEVDVAAAVSQQQAEEPRQKRKYTRKTALTLPANLT